MYVLVVTIDIKPQFKDRFMAEMLDDARGSVRDEPGCLRFDVIQDEKEPNRIYLYEVYADRAAFDVHMTTPHFLKWKRRRPGLVRRPAGGGRRPERLPRRRRLE